MARNIKGEWWGETSLMCVVSSACNRRATGVQPAARLPEERGIDVGVLFAHPDGALLARLLARVTAGVRGSCRLASTPSFRSTKQPAPTRRWPRAAFVAGSSLSRADAAVFAFGAQVLDMSCTQGGQVRVVSNSARSSANSVSRSRCVPLWAAAGSAEPVPPDPESGSDRVKLCPAPGALAVQFRGLREDVQCAVDGPAQVFCPEEGHDPGLEQGAAVVRGVPHAPLGVDGQPRLPVGAQDVPGVSLGLPELSGNRLRVTSLGFQDEQSHAGSAMSRSV